MWYLDGHLVDIISSMAHKTWVGNVAIQQILGILKIIGFIKYKLIVSRQ